MKLFGIGRRTSIFKIKKSSFTKTIVKVLQDSNDSEKSASPNTRHRVYRKPQKIQY